MDRVRRRGRRRSAGRPAPRGGRGRRAGGPRRRTSTRLRRDGLTLASPDGHPHDRTCRPPRTRRAADPWTVRRPCCSRSRATRPTRRSRTSPSCPLVDASDRLRGENGVANERPWRAGSTTSTACADAAGHAPRARASWSQLSASTPGSSTSAAPVRRRRHRRELAGAFEPRRFSAGPARRDAPEVPQAPHQPRQRRRALRLWDRGPGRTPRAPSAEAERALAGPASTRVSQEDDRERRGDQLRVTPIAGAPAGAGRPGEPGRGAGRSSRLPQRRGGAPRPAARHRDPANAAAAAATARADGR